MKNIKLIFSFVLVLAVSISCSIPDGISQDLSSMGTITNPSNVASIFNISTDNSGKVTITPSGDATGTYDVYFGDTTTVPANVQAGSSVDHKYKEGSYNVKIVAKGLNGVNVEKTYPLIVVNRSPQKLAVTSSVKVHNIKVKAVALYEVSYLVYFGDVVGEIGTPMTIGQELSHDYIAAGTYNLKVVALSGGVATSIENTSSVKIYDAFMVPMTFEDPKVNYFFGTFDDWGQQQFSTADNPDATGLNTSAKVGKYTSGHAGWSGTYSPLDVPINFATGNKVRIWVYNPDPTFIGKKLNVELEAGTAGSPANGVGVLKVPFTRSGAWEELVFDFSSIPGFPLTTAQFNQLVLRFDDGHTGGGAIFYIDNIRFTY